MASLALRSGVKVDEVIDQLKGITCPACTAMKAKGKQLDGISCADIIAKTLQEFVKMESNSVEAERKTKMISEYPETKEEAATFNKPKYAKCPECGEMTLTNQEGCNTCLSCGYSKCSN